MPDLGALAVPRQWQALRQIQCERRRSRPEPAQSAEVRADHDGFAVSGSGEARTAYFPCANLGLAPSSPTSSINRKPCSNSLMLIVT